jgi:uncharacterized protein (DUF2236 family)
MSHDLPISWAIHREVVLLLGWGRAILMQFAHPLVARGVAEHSGFRAEAFGGWRRLHRTLGAMLALTFGDRDDALRAAGRINAIHDRIHGTLSKPEGAFPAGTRYSAHDPELLRWVHVTLVDSFLLAYALYVRPLSRADRDRYCAESAQIETLLGMPEGWLPRSEAALKAYLGTMLAGAEITVTETARELAHDILWPPGSALAWPALATVRLAIVGLLPPTLREGYGFGWDRRRTVALRASAAVIRGVLPIVPPALRYWPAARTAMRHRHAML